MTVPFVYWLKCLIGINVSENYSFSRQFPLSYIARAAAVIDPSPGVVLENTFDSFSLFGNWGPIVAREKEKVTRLYETTGIGSSRCLVIENKSSGTWASSLKKYIRVKEGDSFRYEVAAKQEGDSPVIMAGIAVYDEQLKVQSYHYQSTHTEQTGQWVRLQKTFTIPANVAYMKPRLAGKGTGRFSFDNVRLEMIPQGRAVQQ